MRKSSVSSKSFCPIITTGIPSVWSIPTNVSACVQNRTGKEVLSVLSRELPQCNIKRMVSEAEAERFAKSVGGYFPKPSYCLDSQQSLGGGKGGIVLLGDAIHAFPPDLGAGVNSAFDDVMDFSFALDRVQGDWSQALPQYEAFRRPQSEAICNVCPRNWTRRGVGKNANMLLLLPGTVNTDRIPTSI